MKNENNLINWSELSRLLTTSRDSIRPNRIPKKHQEAINELKELIKKWKEKHYG